MLLKLSKFFVHTSVLSVLIVLTSTFFPFIGGKTYFFRTAIQLALVFFVIWWGFEAGTGEVWERCKNMFRKPLFAAVSGFSLIFLLASLFAFDSHAAFWSNYERGEGGFMMLHYYALFFLLVFLFRERKDWKRLFWVSIAAAVFMILYGIGAAVFTWNSPTQNNNNAGYYSNPFSFVGPYTPPHASPENIAKLSPTELAKLPQKLQNNLTFWGRLFHTERFQGSLGNPAYVAPYLMFSFFYLLWLWFSEKGGSLAKNFSYGVLGFFFIAFFLLSKTRGAFVGLAVSIFVFLAILAFGYPKIRKWLVFLIVSLTLIFGLLIYYKNSDFVKKLPASRVLDIELSDKTFQTRLWTWNSAWQGFKERPLLGWGPENFSGVFDKYFDTRHYIPGEQSETWFDYAHSIVFDYLVETGILGLLSFLAIFVIFYWEWVKRFKGGSPALKALLAALPIGYLVQGLALFNVLAIYINIFLFMAFACYKFYYSEHQ